MGKAEIVSLDLILYESKAGIILGPANRAIAKLPSALSFFFYCSIRLIIFVWMEQQSNRNKKYEKTANIGDFLLLYPIRVYPRPRIDMSIQGLG